MDFVIGAPSRSDKNTKSIISGQLASEALTMLGISRFHARRVIGQRALKRQRNLRGDSFETYMEERYFLAGKRSYLQFIRQQLFIFRRNLRDDEILWKRTVQIGCAHLSVIGFGKVS